MAPAAAAAAQAAVAVSDAPSSLPIVNGVARDDVLDAVKQYEVRSDASAFCPGAGVAVTLCQRQITGTTEVS
jgi:hypothetical protein